MADKSTDKSTNKSAWMIRGSSNKTDKTTKQCQEIVGGSVRYGHGGKWAKDGQKYLALNGHLSRGGMPLKLTTKDGDIPISSTDLTVLVKKGAVAGVTPVEFE